MLVLGRGNVALATATKTFAELFFNDTNIYIIFEVGETLKSWKPGRTINAINGIQTGLGYWVVPKVNIDIPELVGVVDILVLEGSGTAITYP